MSLAPRDGDGPAARGIGRAGRPQGGSHAEMDRRGGAGRPRARRRDGAGHHADDDRRRPVGRHDRAGVRARHRDARRRAGLLQHGQRARRRQRPQIELRTLDDGYEPDRALANTRRFIETDQAFALFGYVGTPTTIAAMPVFTKAQVPLIGPFTGAESFRKPVNRYIFNVRASYYDGDRQARRAAGRAQSMQRIAVFYQNDAYGKAGLEGVERAAKTRNMPIAATAHRRAQLDRRQGRGRRAREGRPAGGRDDQRVQVRAPRSSRR